MTDDQTVESMRVMPNVKTLLADRGVTFDNSFVSYSLCCPSRATYLTGQYAHNHGVLHNNPPFGGFIQLDSTNTLPVWLQGAGYRTMHVGRYLNGYEAKYGIPVVFFTTGGHADYHQVTDEAQYIDYDRLSQVSSLVFESAARIANLDHRLVVDKPKPDPRGRCVQ